MGPVVRRSWAPRGHTPVLMQRGRYRINVSVIGALVITPRRRVRAYFSLSPGASFDGEHILAFLKQLCRAVRVPIELVWDRLPAHRGQPVKGWLERNPHRMRATLLPPYAPELNPVELMWGYAKTNCLANFARTSSTNSSIRRTSPPKPSEPITRSWNRFSSTALFLFA